MCHRLRARRDDGLDDLGVKHKSHLCALQPSPEQMCEPNCCSGGGGDAAEGSPQAAPVNADHLERRHMSCAGWPADKPGEQNPRPMKCLWA